MQRFRPLLHAGRTVRGDVDDDASRLVHGVIAPDRGEALFSLATTAASRVSVPPPLRLPGLDPDRRYRVALVPLGAAPRAVPDAPPAWFAAGEISASGRVLAEVGIPVPLLAPEQAIVLHALALD